MAAFVTTADNRWGHLYPSFAHALHLTLVEVQVATGEPWELVEGLRSKERQLWLYGQGRPGLRPYGRRGRQVTWVQEPDWHGKGLAGDVEPVHKGYAAPREWWVKLQEIGQRHGLHDPPWRKGDLGHLQLDVPKGSREYEEAARWVAQGCPPVGEGPMDDPRIRPGPVFVGAHVLEAGRPVSVESIGWQGHQYLRATDVLHLLGVPLPPDAWQGTPEGGQLSLPQLPRATTEP